MKDQVHQTRFLNILKQLVPPNINLAHEISSVLGISVDRAYRRLRGETPLTLDEAVVLSLRFEVPLEAMNNEIPDVITFHFNKLQNTRESFLNYMTDLAGQVKQIARGGSPYITYAAEDIPVFHHFAWPLMARFKSMYWMKSILNVPELEMEKFPCSEEICLSDERYLQLYDGYASIPGTEIWTDVTIESSLQQIRFYYDAGFFKEKKDALDICEQLNLLMRRLQRQTEIGQKINSNGASTGAPFTFYLCDLMIGNNGVQVQSGESSTSFIGYNSFNYMHTFNHFFNKQNKQWLDNLIRKSMLISGVAEKLRNQFFKGQFRKIEQLVEYIG